MTTYKYPLPFVEGSGFAIVGGTVQLAVNQNGAAGTYELDDDPEDMLVQAYFRVEPDLFTTEDDDPDEVEDDDLDPAEGEDFEEDDAWAADEDGPDDDLSEDLEPDDEDNV